MKKNILIALMLAMVANAFAVEVEINGLWYELVTKIKEAKVIQYKNGIMYSGDIVIPETVEYEGVKCSVTSIGENAFYNCYNLTSITISDSVKTIGKDAFYSCNSLTSITIPNNVTSIENEVFMRCSNLTSITIPISVTSIGNYAFCRCSNLTSITIPNSVTNIGDAAFDNCISLTSITIPSSVTNIGTNAFGSCKALTTVNISDLEAWCEIAFGAYPFTYDYHLFLNGEEIKELVIPSSITSIGNFTFWACIGLTSVIIPSSVTSIGDCAFAYCSNLKSITFQDGVTSIGNSAFWKCTSLNSVEIPKSVTKIGDSAFCGCNSLGSITIPNSVTIIKELAFGYCSRLTTIIIGYGVETIYSSAFAYCPELTDVYCYAEKVPNMIDWLGNVSTSAFEGSYIEYAMLHVPEASINDYLTIEPWKNFKAIVKALPLYNITYLVDGEVYKTYQIEESTNIIVESEPTKEGYTFSGWSEMPDSMPAHDVTVIGTFTINKYKLIYIVDGKEYKNYEVEYGAAIATEAEPEKEGYTFSGWSEIPATMPAKDVTITGTFSINSYKLTYMIDDKVYKVITYEYGATITPEPQPEGDYQTFEWTDLPATMPAHDVVVYATYISGIAEVLMDTQRKARIYSPNGKKLDKPQKGLNIVIFNDGTVKKMVVK